MSWSPRMALSTAVGSTSSSSTRNERSFGLLACAAHLPIL
jgi:hypothetical protein